MDEASGRSGAVVAVGLRTDMLGSGEVAGCIIVTIVLSLLGDAGANGTLELRQPTVVLVVLTTR